MHVFLVLITGFLVYFNTITAPFMFDDFPYLANNPAVKNFSFFTDTHQVLRLGIPADVQNNFILRPVSYFTFALNYALHGLDVRGYHLTNLIIHIGNALLVYLLLFLMLQTPSMATEAEEKPAVALTKYRYLPLFCALLFVCHPLQTQAVTYIIQRFSSLVVLFYLGSLVMYLNSRLATAATPRITWYLLALFSCVLAMNSKENGFTLPVVIALIEFMFFSGDIGKRVVRLAPFILTMAIIPINLMFLATVAKPAESDLLVDSINLVNFRGVSSWEYLMTQFGVITKYLRLLVLPIAQNLDYDYHLQRSFFSVSVLLPLCLLLTILGAGIYIGFRSRDRRQPQFQVYKLIAFGVCWFFIALAVESSVIPIDDLIFEHRAYLPSVGFFIAIIALATAAYGHRTGKSIFESKTATMSLIVVVICLTGAGIARNSVWADKVTLWRDVADKSPNKARVHHNLGVALTERGDLEIDDRITREDVKLKFRTTGNEAIEEGIKEFRTAIRLRPGFVLAHIFLGNALKTLKRYDEATTELMTAAQLNPKNPLPHIILGELHEDLGESDKARSAYSKAITLDPMFPLAHLRLGRLYAREGLLTDAITELEKSVQLYPDQAIESSIAELKGKVGRL
ncbi:transmembrane and TPR repeat-containing protein 4 [Geobacter sp. OR-1]|uniref:tetratricopeptide repeat protein n=1 Tax=Geobacter sp. OR-1 TaxID=1266765 RepID=UPI000541B7A2|nr:tetratricopeptide repeat protein [Geobacter sp. OR-1]GAM09298.1 transmembrane and TPR repeat-containing protein 4 [Geobacter sp. OR-1]